MKPIIKSIEEYHKAYAQSVDNPEAFWSKIAENFTWKQKWSKVIDCDFNTAKINWFVDGKLNITENILERNLAKNPTKNAIIWEANNPDEANRFISYQELSDMVCKCANTLKRHGVQKADRVCIYMPMVPELAVALLACARIGAVHSVVFAGFSANALADRINDSSCKVLLTSDGQYRGNKEINIKHIADDALLKTESITSVIVYKRTKQDCTMHKGRDYWWHDEMELSDVVCPAETMDAEDMLFILYTSGSTGRPKGVVHTCAGYMIYTWYTFINLFQPDDNDVYWCTADIGWITGHSYIVYGPLLAGATSVMFEGVPTWPDSGRFWEICDKLKVTQFYTAPTAIRTLMAAGLDNVLKYSLDSLKIIGSVGEPINEEAWHWYDENIGKKKCPLIDTWWQTETGGCMISPIPHVTKLIPSYATLPLPGVQAVLLDTEGNEIHENHVEGLLCIKYPWPGMLRTIYGDHNRFYENYFKIYKGYYFTGDGAKRDQNGNYRIIGRIDDVLNVSGHRIGTAEVENAINQHPYIVESAVVAFPHDIKGQGIYAYVICTNVNYDENTIKEEILSTVTKEIGPIAKPDKIQFVEALPKTRSGKIMRRILRKIASGDTSGFGDTSTLLNPEIIEIIQQNAL